MKSQNELLNKDKIDVTGTESAPEAQAAAGTTGQPETEEKPRKRRKHPTLAQMENHRLVLVNTADQPEIAEQMAQMGYTAEVLDVGKGLYDKSIAAFLEGSMRKSHAQSAQKAFSDRWEVLRKLFANHMKRARVVFRRNENAQLALSLKGASPLGYLPLMAKIMDFYNKVSAEEKYMQEMARLGFTEEDLNEGLNLIKEVNVLRSTYMKKKAEAQDSTDKRNDALRKAEHWMQDFLAVAEIAVSESPQLQEAFGKIVRN